MKTLSARQTAPRPAARRRGADKPRPSHPRLIVSLAEVLGCLQEVTDDDRLVVAAVADMMARGKLRLSR